MDFEFISRNGFTKKHMEFMGSPVGNPYRFKNDMPFIIAPAFAAAGTAFAAVGVAATAATIGAAAVATIGAIAAVATVAGLGMTVVGMATGNKDLMKIGAIVGLAGGIGSIASGLALGAGGLSAAAASDVASATASGASSFGASGMSALNFAIPTTGSAVGNTMGVTMAGTASQASTGTSGLTAGLNSILGSASSMGMNAAGAGAAETGMLASGASTGVGSISANYAASIIPEAGASVGNTIGAITPSATTAGGGGFFSDLLSTPTAKMEALKMGFGAIQGMQNSGQNDATTAYYNAKAAETNAGIGQTDRKINIDQQATDLKKDELAMAQKKIDDDRKMAQDKIDKMNEPVFVPRMYIKPKVAGKA